MPSLDTSTASTACEAEARILRAVFAIELMAGTWVIDLAKIKGILTGDSECHGHEDGYRNGV